MRRTSTAPRNQTLVDISEDADLTAAFSIAGYERGLIHCPADLDGTDLKIHLSWAQDGTFTPLVLASDASDVVLKTAASKSVPIPVEAFAAHWCKIETVTDQATTDTQFIVTLSG